MKNPLKHHQKATQESKLLFDFLTEHGFNISTLMKMLSIKEDAPVNNVLEGKVIVYDNRESIFLEKSNIMYAVANGAYTKIYLNNSSPILISKNLKVLSEKLQDKRFIRPHKSYLVNSSFISKYVKGDGGYLVLQNHTTIPVSMRKRNELQEFIEQMSV